MTDHIEQLKQGWLSHDVDMMLAALADDFVYDDPIDGRFTKETIADYYRSLPDAEMVLSDEVLREEGGEQTLWYWWTWKPEGGSDPAQEGAAIARADADGVHSERITYYTRAEPS